MLKQIFVSFFSATLAIQIEAPTQRLDNCFEGTFGDRKPLFITWSSGEEDGSMEGYGKRDGKYFTIANAV